MPRSRQLRASGDPVAFEVIDQRRTVQAPRLLYRVTGHVTPEEIERLPGYAQRASICKQAGPPWSGQLFGQSPHRRLNLITVQYLIGQQSPLSGVGRKDPAQEQCLARRPLAHEAGQTHGGAAGDDSLVASRQTEVRVSLCHHEIHDQQPLTRTSYRPRFDRRQKWFLRAAFLEVPHRWILWGEAAIHLADAA